MKRKIKVGMDISQLAHNGGVATYTKSLAQELSKLPELEMVYFYSSLRKSHKSGLKNVKTFKLPPTLFEMIFNRWRNVSIERFLGPLDIFHSSDWTQPPSKASKVTTIHDLSPIKYPQWSHPNIVKVHQRKLKLVEREVDRVITVSESTKKDLLELFHIPEERISVIYEGPSHDFKEPSDKEKMEFKKKYNLPDRFILAIGGVGERRNLKRIKQASSNYPLIITGENIPWLSLDELGLLYHSATVLVYCSLYEGFGLPVLDAFYCNLPVITSNVSSMPEVGGEAAMYVDPVNLEDIREKIQQVMEDEKLRQDLIKKGATQVKKFSWEKCAKETFNVYKETFKASHINF